MMFTPSENLNQDNTALREGEDSLALCKNSVMNWRKKLDYLRKQNGWTQADLSKAVGVGVSTISSWTKGTRSPEMANLEKLASVFGLSLQEFLEESDPKPSFSNKYTLIPPYDDRVAVESDHGYGNLMVDEPESRSGDHMEISNTHAYRTEWLKKRGLKAESLRVVVATGYSMEPRISEGDLLLVDLADKTIQSGDVYVIAFPSEGLKAKRLFWMADGRLKISSDNPDKSKYPDEVYSPEEVRRINLVGHVVHRGGEKV